MLKSDLRYDVLTAWFLKYVQTFFKMMLERAKGGFLDMFVFREL